MVSDDDDYPEGGEGLATNDGSIAWPRPGASMDATTLSLLLGDPHNSHTRVITPSSTQASHRHRLHTSRLDGLNLRGDSGPSASEVIDGDGAAELGAAPAFGVPISLPTSVASNSSAAAAASEDLDDRGMLADLLSLPAEQLPGLLPRLLRAGVGPPQGGSPASGPLIHPAPVVPRLPLTPDPPAPAAVVPSVTVPTSVGTSAILSTWEAKDMMEAVMGGDCAGVACRLRRGEVFDWNARDEYHRPPLHWACDDGHEAIVLLMIANGADVNQTDEEGCTALHACGFGGHKPIAEILLKAGTDVNVIDDAGETALTEACRYGRLDFVKCLCSHGAFRNGTEMAEAEEEEHPEVVEWLRCTYDCITPLHHVHLVPPPRARALLREGADILAKRRANGPTPLSIARDLIVRGAAPPGSTPRLIVQHNCKSLHRRWRVVARMVGRLVVMRKRSAERLYAPGGAGAEASRAEFERLSLD